MRRDLLAALASGRSRPPPLVLNFRTSALSFGTTAPAGCGYTRAACSSSVQTGTSALFDLTAFAAIPNVLAWGRADDAWEYGLLLEEARTNIIPSATFWDSGATTIGSVTVTASQSDPASGTRATRLQATSGSVLYASIATVATAISYSQWSLNVSPPAGVIHAFETSLGAQYNTSALAVDGLWRRYASPTGTALLGAPSAFPIGVEGRARGVVAAGARDVRVAFPQLEAGGYATEWIPPTGATTTRNATFLRALSATVAPKLSTGRLSIELKFRAKGARTEYSGTHSLWYVDANNQAAFVASTGVLTITVAGATNTCTLPAWARYDLVEISVQCGGSLATVVKYRLNSGAVVSLAITGTALGTHATGDVYLFSTNAGQHLSCWAYVAAFYAPGAPSWAS